MLTARTTSSHSSSRLCGIRGSLHTISVTALPLQDPAYGGDPAWLTNDVVPEYDGRIFINLPAACTLMLIQQQ